MPAYCNLASARFEGVGKYGIPEIQPVYECDINKWINFNYVKPYATKKDVDMGVHFFMYDSRFERVWNIPDKYITYLSRYSCVLSPDFSLYTDFPLAISIYNHYRKHWLGAYWQSKGINVIPTISWSDEDSFEWCFDGEPKNSVVAVSDVGCRRNKNAFKAFMRGYEEMLYRLNPSKILLYSKVIDTNYGGNVKHIRYSNRLTEGEL